MCINDLVEVPKILKLLGQTEANVNTVVTLSGRTGSALVWHSEVAGSRMTQCSKSCDLQPALQCAIRGAQWVLPCVGWGVRPVNWIYRL